MHRTLSVFFFTLSATLPTFSSAAAVEKWIVGSYVNVRAQPYQNAIVEEHLVANTLVKLLSQQGEFCEITWGSGHQGFVACNLLGNEALHIENVGTKPNDGEKPSPQYSPSRAFWIEPTIERLFDAGEYFRSTMLSPNQLKSENDYPQNYWGTLSQGDSQQPPKLKRFPLPEFDAMKKMMVAGIVAPRSQYVPLMSWNNIRIQMKDMNALPKADQHQYLLRFAPSFLITNGEKFDVVKYERIKLPIVKPSYFKDPNAIGRPSADAEQLSAQYQIQHRLTVLDKPTWGGDSNSYPILMGAWDIGRVETRLVSPVYEIAIDIDGEISIGKTVAKTQYLKGEDTCRWGFMKGTSNKPLPGYKINEDPWIFFRLATVPAITKAKVIIRKSSQDNAAKVDGSNFQLTTARVDLDNDGVTDVFVWDDGIDGYDHQFPGNVARTRLIFANVAGQWYLLDSDQEQACNC